MADKTVVENSIIHKLEELVGGTYARVVTVSTPTAIVTNRSGTIAVAAAAQVLMPENLLRTGFWVQNNSAGDLWISEIGTAAAEQPSMKLATGTMYASPVTGCPATAISIFGATLAQAFSAREF